MCGVYLLTVVNPMTYQSVSDIEKERIKITIDREKNELPPEKPMVPMDLTMALERGACQSQGLKNVSRRNPQSMT